MPSVTTQISPTANPSLTGTQQYTPPNWSTNKALYAILVRDVTNTQLVQPDETQDAPIIARTNVAGSTVTMFVFDGMRQADHEQSCIPTQHPIQTGINISDHAVLQPARLVLEVAMSDAIGAYSSGMWSGNPSKSVSAFQQMITLMTNRALLTINTRLMTYTNMLLIDVRSPDNQRNYFGAVMTLTFQQLQISNVSTSFDSARSQTTSETALGTNQTQQPNQTVLAQHTVANPKVATNGSGTSVVPPAVAGVISSNPTSLLNINGIY